MCITFHPYLPWHDQLCFFNGGLVFLFTMPRGPAYLPRTPKWTSNHQWVFHRKGVPQNHWVFNTKMARKLPYWNKIKEPVKWRCCFVWKSGAARLFYRFFFCLIINLSLRWPFWGKPVKPIFRSKYTCIIDIIVALPIFYPHWLVLYISIHLSP